MNRTDLVEQMVNEAITEKIVIEGILVLETPAIIGSGNDDAADIELVRDSSGSKPFIPGTSLAGALRHYFFEYLENLADYSKVECDEEPVKKVGVIEDIKEPVFKKFWGFTDKMGKNETTESSQSSLIIDDLLPANDIATKIRDGVRIEYKTQIAEDKGKYDYEVIERGAGFSLKMELTLRKEYNEEKIEKREEQGKNFKRILATVIENLKDSKISIGAKNASGFGRCRLKDIKYYDFTFDTIDDIIKWLQYPDKRDFFADYTVGKLGKSIVIPSHDFIVEADFSLKSAMIIRAFPEDIFNEMVHKESNSHNNKSDDSKEKKQIPDAVHITSAGEPVLPGTSSKGALRHRALKILNTLGKAESGAIIESLFGIAGNKETDKKRRSRFITEECLIENVDQEAQNRLKIDRFTGGTIKAALFDSMPLWNKNGNNRNVRMKITIINYEDHEAGLLLLLLKDLWTEDLATGGEKNVGRGVMKGLKAEISFDEPGNRAAKRIHLHSNNPVLCPPEDKVVLQKFVTALSDYNTIQRGGK